MCVYVCVYVCLFVVVLVFVFVLVLVFVGVCAFMYRSLLANICVAVNGAGRANAYTVNGPDIELV